MIELPGFFGTIWFLALIGLITYYKTAPPKDQSWPIHLVCFVFLMFTLIVFILALILFRLGPIKFGG